MVNGTPQPCIPPDPMTIGHRQAGSFQTPDNQNCQYTISTNRPSDTDATGIVAGQKVLCETMNIREKSCACIFWQHQ